MTNGLTRVKNSAPSTKEPLNPLPHIHIHICHPAGMFFIFNYKQRFRIKKEIRLINT